MRRNFKQKWKKLCATVLAAGMVVTSCPAGVWGAVGDADNGCIKVTNRNTFTSGPSFDVTGKLSTEKTYTVSMKIKYTGAKASRTFEVYMENAPKTFEAGDGIWNYRQKLGNAVVNKGEWKEFKIENYQPGTSGASKNFYSDHNALVIFTPYAESNADTDEFYVDDVLIQENSGSEILKEGFDSSAGTAKGNDGASINWLKEGDEKEEVPPDPSEIVPLQVNGDAETGDTAGWAVSTGGGEKATLTATSEDKYAGNYSIKVAGRGGCTSGPMQDLSGKLTAGKKYKVTGRIKYTTGPDNKEFQIWYQHGGTYENRTQARSVSAKKGKWTQLYGTFTAKGTGTDQVFIATPWAANPSKETDLMDFYVDDIVITLDDGNLPEEDPQEHECIEGATLVSGALKGENHNTRVNPLFDYKFGADPYAITYNGRVYVYMTNDSQQLEHNKDEHGYPVKGNGFEKINTLNVFSSADMVNWTDHGEISVAGKGAANLSWAPAVGHKTINGKEKFFLYFANGGGGIYVLESDSPIGPFEVPAATGTSTLITRDMPQGSGIPYLFDPAVLVDDDGTGYLYYGGGFPDGSSQEVINNPKTFRVVKLKDNMVELDGDAVMIEAPGNFEDSGIHKYKGKYYFTYCSNFANNLEHTGTGNICAMVSDNPMTGFQFAGIVFPNQGNFFGAGAGGNNHHCFFEFNGKNYLTYHAQTLAVALGFFGKDQSGYRSTHIDEFEYSADGKISVVGTWEGSKQIKALNPYERVEAETIAWSKGIKADACNQEGSLVKGINMKVTEITNGDYLAVSNADFGSGSGKFTMHVAGLAGGTVELHLDGTAGEKVGEVQVPAGDGNTWTDVSCNAAITGNHSLYLVFKGGAGQLMYADYWKFDTKSGTGTGGNGNGDTQLTPEQQSQVDVVIALINKIGTVTNSQASKAAIDAARAAYDKLTDEQKKQVTNFNVLTEAEKTYQEIKAKEDKSPVKKGQSYSFGNYRYKVLNVSKKTVAVTKTLKASKTIKVPNTVKIKGKTFKVTEIAKGAFKNNKKVETVTIGKYVTKIGANAFSGSKKLKKVTINSTVLTTIDKQAFYNCKKLATVKIVSQKLKTVAKQSFKGTAKKIKVDVPNSKKKAYKKLFKKNSGISSKAVFK